MQRFTVAEQRPQRLEQTKCVTQNGDDEEAERSTRAVARGSPTNTSEDQIKKFLNEVILKRHSDIG